MPEWVSNPATILSLLTALGVALKHFADRRKTSADATAIIEKAAGSLVDRLNQQNQDLSDRLTAQAEVINGHERRIRELEQERRLFKDFVAKVKRVVIDLRAQIKDLGAVPVAAEIEWPEPKGSGVFS